MRNNALTIMLICFFLVLTFNFTYFNIKTFKTIDTSNNPTEITTIKDAVELFPYKECSSSARSMCLIEQNSGRILYGKNINEKVAMASTTKIFTALTVLENCQDINKKIAIDDRAVGIEGTSMYLRKGESLTIKELLYGMMLPSGNDSATALAYYVGGDIPKFCEMMQKTAQNAGAKNSSFKNPHGLDEDGHYTTAYDLSIVTAKALQNKDFKEIVSTKNIVVSGNDEVENRYLKNKNKLLLNDFEGITGVKTGFTDNAGRCFVSSASRENLDVVCSVLNCGPMFEECSYFMEKAFDEFKNYELLPAYNIVDTVPVTKGKESLVKIYSRKNFVFPLTTEEFLKIDYEYEKPEFLKAPITKEQIIGTVKIYLDNQLLFKDELITTDEVKSNSIFESIKNIFNKW